MAERKPHRSHSHKSKSRGIKNPVPFHHLFAFRVSVTYTGALFDNGGDRVVHVDVDHRRVDVLLKEVVKKSIEIDDLSAVTKNKRQSMQLVLLDKAHDKTTIWFANNAELDLFHAVVTDLKSAKHPGNRISVPLIRQATITKRNRAGFFNFKHATLMAHKLVITRSKGNSPPEDVITLRDAAVSLDEKKGYITIGVAGKTSVWRGLTTEDTYKWHDALLSALAENVAPRKPRKPTTAPPRLSTMFTDEQAATRVRKTRDSMFAGSTGAGTSDDDSLEPPELDDSANPFPEQLVQGSTVALYMGRATLHIVQKQTSDAEVLSPRSDEAPEATDDDTAVDPVSIVKSVVGQVKQRYKARKDRDRALSTVTHLPDDVAWRQDEVFDDSDGSQSGSDLSDTRGRPGSPAHGKRWSAEENKSAASAAMVSAGKKTHKRTGSAPPNMSPSSLLTRKPATDRSGLLANIPEEPAVEDAAGQTPMLGRASVRFNSNAAAMSELSHAAPPPAPLADSHSSATTLSPRGDLPPPRRAEAAREGSGVSIEQHTPVPRLNLSSNSYVHRSESIPERVKSAPQAVAPVLTPSQSFQQGYRAAMQEHAASLTPPAWQPESTATGFDAWADARYSSTVVHPEAPSSAMPPDVLGAAPPLPPMPSGAPMTASPWRHQWQHLQQQQQRAAHVIAQLQQQRTPSPVTPVASVQSPMSAQSGYDAQRGVTSSGACTTPALDQSPVAVACPPPSSSESFSPCNVQRTAAPTTEQMCASESDATEEVSAAVLQDLEAVWCSHQRLHLMVQTLKGSLTAGESPEAAHEELYRQLDHIEALLGDMPLQPPQAIAMARSVDEGPTPQSSSPMQASTAENAATRGRESVSKHTDTAPVPERTNSPVPPQLRLSAERLSSLSQRMEARSAELTQHVALAMAQLPHLRSRAPSPTRSRSPTLSPTGQTASQSNVCPRLSAQLDSAHALRNGASMLPSQQSAHTTEAVPRQGEGSREAFHAAPVGACVSIQPENYNELIDKIRATEARLQEAICSLTAATRNFRLARIDVATPELANGHSAATVSDHAMHSDAAPCEVEDAGGGEADEQAMSLSLEGSLSNAPSPQPAAEDEREVSWTRLNPLYPSSSRSTSPHLRVSHPTRIPSPPRRQATPSPPARAQMFRADRPSLRRSSTLTPPTPRPSALEHDQPPNIARSPSPSGTSPERRSTLLQPRPALHGALPGEENPALASFRLRATSSARWSAKPATLAMLADADEAELHGALHGDVAAAPPGWDTASIWSQPTQVATRPRARTASFAPRPQAISAGMAAAAQRSMSPQRGRLQGAGSVSFREMSQQSHAEAPNMRIARGSVIRESSGASQLSQSTAWSLDQPGLLLSNPHRESMVESSPVRLRSQYQAVNSGNTALADGRLQSARQSAAQPFAPATPLRKSDSLARTTATEPAQQMPRVVTGPDGHSGQHRTWLEEHNAHRVSHYEPTIFTLRQAGIHVEPHWFGPVKPSAEHINDTTRSATDEICRAARSIIQTTTDVEKYVLKRFPLTESPYEDIDAYRSKSASPERTVAPQCDAPREADELAHARVRRAAAPAAYARSFARNTVAAFASEVPDAGPATPSRRGRTTISEGLHWQGDITLRPSVLRADLRDGSAGNRAAPQIANLHSPATDLTMGAPGRPDSALGPQLDLLQPSHALDTAAPELQRTCSVERIPQASVRDTVMLAPPPQSDRLSVVEACSTDPGLWKIRGSPLTPAVANGAESPTDQAQPLSPGAVSHAAEPTTPVQFEGSVATDCTANTERWTLALPQIAENQRRSTVPDLSPEAMTELFSALDRRDLSQQDFLTALFKASGATGDGGLPLGLQVAAKASSTGAQDISAKASEPGVSDDVGDEARISAVPGMRTTRDPEVTV